MLFYIIGNKSSVTWGLRLFFFAVNLVFNAKKKKKKYKNLQPSTPPP